MHVWGRPKEHNAGYSDGHMGAWVANNTNVESKGTQQAPHGGTQPDHSLPAELGGIPMHVWGRTKEHSAGQSEGHMPAWEANNTHVGSKGTQQTPCGGKQADHSPPAEIGGIKMHAWGRARENKAGRSVVHMLA